MFRLCLGCIILIFVFWHCSHWDSSSYLSFMHSFLVRTNCVDTTITNLLESTEQYHTEPADGPSRPSTSNKFPVASQPSTVKVRIMCIMQNESHPDCQQRTFGNCLTNSQQRYTRTHPNVQLVPGMQIQSVPASQENKLSYLNAPSSPHSLSVK